MAQKKQPKNRSGNKKTVKTHSPTLELKVLNESGKTIEKIPLDDIIAGSGSSPHLMYQTAVMAQANRRLGTAKVKDRSEVSGGGKKPWRQKGTGRSRHGSIRSPLWRKGGVTFGPAPRDYAYQLPRRMKTLALIAGLKVKAQEGKLFLIDEFVSKNGKTKEMFALTEKLALQKPVVITDASDALTMRSVRNLKNVHITTSEQVAPYDVLASNECLVTKKGYACLLKRLKAKVKTGA